MKIYWVSLEVVFKVKLPFIVEGKVQSDGAQGYVQEIGCSAETKQQMKDFVFEYLKGLDWLDLDKADVIFDRIGVISKNDIEDEIYGDEDIAEALISSPLNKGIWYLSGRGIYSDEIEEGEFYQAKIVKFENEK